jgi:hypothetical protein
MATESEIIPTVRLIMAPGQPRDLYFFKCPIDGKRILVSGDDIDYSKKNDGTFTPACGHKVRFAD